MRTKLLDIQGFRSFKRRTKYRYPGRNGLYLIRGSNLVEPTLGANGAGKSTFAQDALLFCWFGSTARGLKSVETESWGEGVGNTVRSVIKKNDGREFEIVRTRAPIALKINGTVSSQEQVNDLLGFDYQMALHLMMFGQFGTLFVDMRPAERLALVSNVLGLDNWTQCSQRAADKVRQLDEQKIKIDTEATTLARELEQAKRYLDEAKGNNKGWRKGLRDTRIAIKAEIKALLEERSEYGTRLLDKKIADLNTQLDANERKMSTLAKKERACREAALVLKTEMQSFYSRAQEKKRIRDAAEKYAVRGSTCPTCHQDIDEEVAEQIIKTADEHLKLAEQLQKERKAESESKEREAQDFQEQLGLIDGQLTELRQSRNSHNAKRSAIAEKVKAINDKIANLTARYDEAKSGVSPHADTISNLEAEIAKLSDEQSDVALEARKVNELIQAFGIWPKSFKELRLWLIDSALAELSIKTNSSLVELGLHGWEIRFSVERENKSGSITRGFDITVRSPNSPEGVPFESWSGGETQRLRIACAVGLADLIRARIPDPPRLEVWDEPTAHLNREGVRDLVEFFKERSHGRQVFLVDHRALDSGEFDGTVTVVKDEHGSRLQV